MAIQSTTVESYHPALSTYQQLAGPWRRLGIWLRLWDARAEPLEAPAEDKSFWDLLFKHSPRFQQALRVHIRGLSGDKPREAPLENHAALVVISLPVRVRREITGYLTACGLTAEFFDSETFARFCSRYELDGPLFQRLAAQVPAHTAEAFSAYAEILGQHFAVLNDSARSHREIRDLSLQLARSYEELNLIFRVSSGFSVSSRPIAYFDELGRELLGVTVVESLATVIEPSPELRVEPTVVMAGPVQAANELILRLYRQARERVENAHSWLLINNVKADPEFAWAADWLERFIFFRLSKNEHNYGGILALNHVDRRDFGSEEIRFINALAERSSAFLESVRLYNDLEQLFMGMLHALVNSIDAKDPYTCGHSQRVAWLSRFIAGLAGVSETQCQRVYLSGLLHDIGKIGISESVLGKTGRLSSEEFEVMKKHPEIGAHILEGMKQVEDLIPGVLCHHERIDGKGYPMGLKGGEIPLWGRIVGLADCLDAMTTNRTYRKALPLQIAIAEIRRFAGTQFDPILADLLLSQDIPALFRKIPHSDRAPL